MSSLSSYSVPLGYEHPVFTDAKGNVIFGISDEHVFSVFDFRRGRVDDARAQNRGGFVRHGENGQVGKDLRRIDGVFRRHFERRCGPLYGYVSNSGTAEFRHHRAGSEFGTDVPRERADVGSCGYLANEGGERKIERFEF